MKPFTSFEELKDMFSKNQSVIEVLELVESHHREAELLEELNTIKYNKKNKISFALSLFFARRCRYTLVDNNMTSPPLLLPTCPPKCHNKPFRMQYNPLLP